jgi:hypothetical protein
MIRKITLGKKAILFSLISVLFAVLFITLFSQNLNTTYEDRLPSSNIRIKVIDTYTRNFEKYVEDSVKVSGYKVLNTITIYRYNNGKFFNNFQEFNKTFHDCLICGYTNCSDKKISTNCNIGSDNLTARLNDISQLSQNQLNIKTQYYINSIAIEQKYAFELEIKINISYNITDNTTEDNYARWSKEAIITQPITIIGLLDPKGYLNDSTNTYKRTIKRYTGISEYNESRWDLTTFTQFYNDNSFRYYEGGSAFLNRYWNNMTPSDCCGIETILHPSELSGIKYNNSYIDNYYWNGKYSCNSTQKILNITINVNNIHLDEASMARYQISNFSTQYCPS